MAAVLYSKYCHHRQKKNKKPYETGIAYYNKYSKIENVMMASYGTMAHNSHERWLTTVTMAGNSTMACNYSST